jgi:hypothetical protein
MSSQAEKTILSLRSARTSLRSPALLEMIFLTYLLLTNDQQFVSQLLFTPQHVLLARVDI